MTLTHEDSAGNLTTTSTTFTTTMAATYPVRAAPLAVAQAHLVPLALAALLVLVVLQLGRTWWRLRHIPGPFLARFTNLQRIFWVKTTRAHLILQEEHARHGEVVRIGPNTVSISNPEVLPVIYTTRTGFPKSDFYPTLQGYTPNGGKLEAIFNTTSDDVHKSLKGPIAPLFTLANVPYLEPRVDEVLECLRDKLDANFVQNNVVINLGQWAQYFAFDVMGILTFSKRYGFLDTGKDVGNMLQNIVHFMRVSAPYTQIPWFDKLARKNRVGDFLQRVLGLQASMGILAFVGKAIADKKQQRAEQGAKLTAANDANDDKYGRGKDFLTRYIEIVEKDSAPVAWTFSNVIAGSDSVGSLMGTTLFNLLQYPHTLDALYRELRDANVSMPFPKWSEVRNLPYLDACVQEGVRMHPPFNLPFERVVPKGGITILGSFLPEGTVVGGSPFVVNRHKGWFGDDADFWRPERWLEKDEAHKKKLEQGILTFGGGRRICLGRYVGILEIKKLIPFLILNYDIRIVDPERFQVENSWFFFQSGLWATMKKRPQPEQPEPPAPTA
ncbi:Cytochrome P450 CYP4/CYP19/CYP26 subfamilies [Colletotrichum higginsianum IMI 349063]|uniref:Cytochrome P450 CYP4/CYP19/CYP26 subfamilies n=1 Tax=Colletotrichum higginsianum (strain IMI 349063) TaxID=759273 RepID=A0A1B7XTU5_COLHI|nr:Cytochrome P450 CYP4/CYP19/CYP26 subfamilies [Colletotrichum higginsianum IMI 349063]OBR03144.1 Cytochrome P450 CYP4/CYP19/CYP26 subfamilies [Colletotrichum higginsianum IMI 349063]